jgi:DNA polymerase III subunit delta'
MSDAQSPSQSPAPPPALAPWLQTQLRALLKQRGHAWLLAGASGLGQYELGLAMVSTWLCEQPTEEGACGQCHSCHLVAARTHPDLCVLMPETEQIALGWPLSEKAQADIDDKKRKPSQEIRVDAMQAATEFAQRTSARGRGKAVLIYPAERMNHVAANALLKTLEEPAGDIRFALASEAAHQLLPTIRSRCMGHNLHWPAQNNASAWLAQSAKPDAAALLAAAGGRPQAALSFAEQGLTAKHWSQIPKAVAKGDERVMQGWAAPQVLDALQKLCHDLMRAKAGAQPRFFSAADLPAAPPMAQLADWSQQLMQSARHIEHPYKADLLLEALVSQARQALHSH